MKQPRRRYIAVLILSAVTAGALCAAAGASAHPQRARRMECQPAPHTRIAAQTSQVVVFAAKVKTREGYETVRNTRYSTCLRRTGRRQTIWTNYQVPSGDGGWEETLDGIRAAGHYVLFLTVYTPDGSMNPTPPSGTFNLIDVADSHDDLTRPDPDYGYVGFKAFAVSSSGAFAWAQVNLGTATDPDATETIEAETGTGSGPFTLATAPFVITRPTSVFTKVGFSGQNVTWLANGVPQRAPLPAYAIAPAASHASASG